MAVRKWFVRGLVFAVTVAVAAAAVLYQRWTHPTSVRKQLMSRLGAYLPGATVYLDSAQMRLLGGIAFRDLRLARKDDPTCSDVARVPSGILYHDKELLLQHGKLAIRKIELERPWLRAERRADGSWNLAGVFGKPRPDEPIPLVVIRQGTILLEDHTRGPDVPPVELRDVSLTVRNDPLPTVQFEASGTTEVIGTLHVHGNWERGDGTLTITLDAPEVPVGPALIKRLAAYIPECAEHARQLEGTGVLRAEWTYHPDAPRPWSHDVQFRLAKGKLSHPQIPVPLDQLEAVLRCTDGLVTLERCTARSGSAHFEAAGKASAPTADADLEGRLTVKSLVASPELMAKLPGNLPDLGRDYQPRGPVQVSCEVSRRGGQWYKHSKVRLDGLHVQFARFPYPLARVSGTLEHESDAERHSEGCKIDLLGYAGTRPVTIKGKVEGDKPAAVSVDITADNVPLDATLEAALQPEHQRIARQFAPAGLADVVARIRRGQGQPKYANQIVVRFHDATACYAVFPYPLEDVSGVLDIQPDHWEFRDFRGTHKGAVVRASGRSHPSSEGPRVTAEIRGHNVLLDEEMERALLKPGLKRAWSVFAPAGRIHFATRVETLPGHEADLDVTVAPAGCSVQPAFFPYSLDVPAATAGVPQGTVRYVRGQVTLENLHARHGATVVRLSEGQATLKPGGGVFVELKDLIADPLVPDADFYLAVLPPRLRSACLALRLRDAVGVRTKLTVDVPAEPGAPPMLEWDGGAALAGAALHVGVPVEGVTGVVYSRGRFHERLEGVVSHVQLQEASVFRQPLRNLNVQLLVDRDLPDALMLYGLKADMYGGNLTGGGRVEFGPNLSYELKLAATQVKLEEFARRNLRPGQHMSGLASSELYLRGRGAELSGLEGTGSLDVPEGKMYNLPLLLDLLKFLVLRVPDQVAFEEAHARFAINGARMKVNQLDLYGNSVSLGGRGSLNLDGSDLNLDLYAVWARIVPMLPPLLNKIPPKLGEMLLKIKATGNVGGPGGVRFEKEPVPVLIEPIKELLGRLPRPGGGDRRQESEDRRQKTGDRR